MSPPVVVPAALSVAGWSTSALSRQTGCSGIRGAARIHTSVPAIRRTADGWPAACPHSFLETQIARPTTADLLKAVIAVVPGIERLEHDAGRRLNPDVFDANRHAAAVETSVERAGGTDWPGLLARDWRGVGDALSAHPDGAGCWGMSFKTARQEIRNPATLKRLIVDLIEPT